MQDISSSSLHLMMDVVNDWDKSMGSLKSPCPIAEV
jgi:hypothetical protein